MFTVKGKNLMLNALGTEIAFVGLHNGTPTEAEPNEVTGGDPAYARKAIAWNAASNGELDSDGAPVFDIPAGATFNRVGFWSASTGGDLLAWGVIPAESYGSQGTYTLDDADLIVQDPS